VASGTFDGKARPARASQGLAHFRVASCCRGMTRTDPWAKCLSPPECCDQNSHSRRRADMVQLQIGRRPSIPTSKRDPPRQSLPAKTMPPRQRRDLADARCMAGKQSARQAARDIGSAASSSANRPTQAKQATPEPSLVPTNRMRPRFALCCRSPSRGSKRRPSAWL